MKQCCLYPRPAADLKRLPCEKPHARNQSFLLGCRSRPNNSPNIFLTLASALPSVARSCSVTAMQHQTLGADAELVAAVEQTLDDNVAEEDLFGGVMQQFRRALSNLLSNATRPRAVIPPDALPIR